MELEKAKHTQDDRLPIVKHSRIMMLKPSEYSGRTGSVEGVLEKKYIVSYDNRYLRFKDVPTFKGFSKTKFLKKTREVARKDPLTGQALQFLVHPITGEVVTDENEHNNLLNSLTEEEKKNLEYKRIYDNEPNPDYLVQKPAEDSEKITYDAKLGGWVIPGERSWVLNNDKLETRPVYGEIETEIPERLKVQCVNDVIVHKASDYSSTPVQGLTRENFQSKYKIYNARGQLVYNNRVLDIQNDTSVIYKLLTSGAIKDVVGKEYIDTEFQKDKSLSENQVKKIRQEMEQKQSLLELEYIYGEYKGIPTVIHVVNKVPMIVKETPIMKKEKVFDLYLKEDNEVDLFILDQRNRVYSNKENKYLSEKFNADNHTTLVPEAIKENALEYDPYEPRLEFNMNDEISKGRVYVYSLAEKMYCKVVGKIPKMVEIKARVTQVVTGKQVRWDRDGPKLKDGDYPLEVHMKSDENYLIRLDGMSGVLPIVSHNILVDGTYIQSPILKSHFIYMDGQVESEKNPGQSLYFEVLEDRKNYIRGKVLEGDVFEERSLLKTDVKFTPEFLKANPDIFSTVSDDTKRWLDYKVGDWDTPVTPPAYVPDSPLQPLKKLLKRQEQQYKQDPTIRPPELVIRPSSDSDSEIDTLDLNLDFDTIQDAEAAQDLDEDAEESKEIDYAMGEADAEGDAEEAEGVEQKVGYNQLSQVELLEKRMTGEKREVLKTIRRILRSFNYAEYEVENIEEIIEKYIAYRDYIKSVLQGLKLERTFTEEPQTMLLLVMCYNLIVMRQIITLQEYLEITVFKKFINASLDKRYNKEQKSSKTIVTLDKTNLGNVWVDAERTLSLEDCDKQVYKETNISNLKVITMYTQYINNIICFLKMNKYPLYVSTMSIVPEELVRLNANRLPESQVKYSFLEEQRVANIGKKDKRSKILRDMEYLANKKKPQTRVLEEEDNIQPRFVTSIHSRVPANQDQDQDQDVKMAEASASRVAKSEEELQEQEARIEARLKEFDKMLEQVSKSKKETVPISDETIQELRPFMDKKSLVQFAEMEKTIPDLESTRREKVISDAILERDRQRRAEFLKQMETLDESDLSELSEQDIQDLEMAKSARRQTQEELQEKFDSVINANYSAPEYADLRAVLVEKQDDINFIRGNIEPRDDTDAAARKILVLFYKAIRDNKKRYDDIQKRRVEIMERVNRARKIRKERARLLKEYEKSSEMGNILGDYEVKEIKKRKRDDDLESLFGSDSEDDSEMDTETSSSRASIFMPRPKGVQRKREEAKSRITAERERQALEQKKREEERRASIERRRNETSEASEPEEQSEPMETSELSESRNSKRTRFSQKWKPYKK